MAKIKIDNLPLEVMIEVEPRCNFNCQFCFNKISFARNGRDIKSFSTDYVKKIIDGVARARIKIIRFTGGEPLLRKDIFELMKYAKNKDLEVRLNTNGSLITQNTARKLNGAVDNVLIPIESYDNKIEEQMTGFHQSLKKKIIAIKLLKKNKIPIVRAGTVASSASIKNFDKMAKLIFSLPIDEWEFYRPISNSQNRQTLKSKDINFLVNKIYELKSKTGRIISIANSIPFCSIKNRGRIAGVSSGALFDDGHNRLVVDPRGFVKPHYFIDKNIGNPLNILGAWNHPFMRRMRNLKYLPKACRTCDFKFKCRGGSRHEAKIAFGSYRALDPLARPKIR
jgi:radical SAM protein with 4Fe4S-binding SPASM domain